MLRPHFLAQSLAVAMAVGVGALVASKVLGGGYGISELLPLTRYDVTLELTLDGPGEDARVRTFLPVADGRQTVDSERNVSPGLHLSTQFTGQSREAVWAGGAVPDGTHDWRRPEPAVDQSDGGPVALLPWMSTRRWRAPSAPAGRAFA